MSMKKSVVMGVALSSLVFVIGVIVLYFNKTSPSRTPFADVQILEQNIVSDGDALMVKGTLLNGTPESITAVHLALICVVQGGRIDLSFMIGSRMENRRVENRMTGQYENREYEVPERIGVGEKYQFEHRIDSKVDPGSCYLSVDGWTDYRTINQ